MNSSTHAPSSAALPGEAEQAPGARAWWAVASLAIGAFVIVTSEFLPVGFLPRTADDLHVSTGAGGLMVLVPGLTAAVAAPLVIVAAGDVDRRRLIVGLTSLVALSNALAAVAPNFTVVLIARAFLGLAIGGFWTVVPPLGERLTGPSAGTRATSLILAGLSVGTVVGLPAGQFLGQVIGWRWTFGAAAMAAAAAVVAQLLLLPGISSTARMRFARFAQVLRVPAARSGLMVSGIVITGQFAASTFVTPFLLQDVHLGSSSASLLFLGYGAAGIAGTLLGGGLVAGRGHVGTFVGAAVTFGVLVMLLPLVSGAPAAVGVLFAAWGLVWGVVPLALQTWLLRSAPHSPEASSAMLITVMQFAIAVGSALGGVLVNLAGPASVFVVGGAVAVASGLLGALGAIGRRRR